MPDRWAQSKWWTPFVGTLAVCGRCPVPPRSLCARWCRCRLLQLAFRDTHRCLYRSMVAVAQCRCRCCCQSCHCCRCRCLWWCWIWWAHLLFCWPNDVHRPRHRCPRYAGHMGQYRSQYRLRHRCQHQIQIHYRNTMALLQMINKVLILINCSTNWGDSCSSHVKDTHQHRSIRHHGHWRHCAIELQHFAACTIDSTEWSSVCCWRRFEGIQDCYWYHLQWYEHICWRWKQKSS